MSPEIVPLEAGDLRVNDGVALLTVGLDDGCHIVADQLRGAAGQYHKKVTLHDLQRGFDNAVKLLGTAEYDLILAGIGTGNIAAAGTGVTLEAVAERHGEILLIDAAGAAVDDGNAARDRRNGVRGTDRARIVRMGDRGMLLLSHQSCTSFAGSSSTSGCFARMNGSFWLSHQSL